MEELTLLEIVIILGIVAIKFGVIFFTVLYVKRRTEKKKRMFLAEEARRKSMQATSSENR